jgi:phosphoribosylaminoimidazole-succinocarboxamide synthase
VTGEDGKIDPGANVIMGELPGMGLASLRMSVYYFELLEKKGLKTHYVRADLDNNAMIVRPAAFFGEGVEIICRFVAVGSFIRRYGKYAASGKKLNALVEMTLKDDERGDPLITDEALEQLGIMTIDQYNQAKELVRNVSCIVRDDLAAKGLELYDIKFELAMVDGQLAIIDDISGGNMRVFNKGEQVDPLVLSALVTAK